MRGITTWLFGDRSPKARRALERAARGALRAIQTVNRDFRRHGVPNPALDTANWHALLILERCERRYDGLPARVRSILWAVHYARDCGPRMALEFLLARPLRRKAGAR